MTLREVEDLLEAETGARRIRGDLWLGVTGDIFEDTKHIFIADENETRLINLSNIARAILERL